MQSPAVLRRLAVQAMARGLVSAVLFRVPEVHRETLCLGWDRLVHAPFAKEAAYWCGYCTCALPRVQLISVRPSGARSNFKLPRATSPPPNMIQNTKIPAPENIGTVEIFGVVLSNVVQAVIIGLKELNIDFIHVPVQPRSMEALRINPFGTVPSLIHRPNTIYSQGRDRIVLFEPLAIARYIDEFLAPAANVPQEKRLSAVLPDPSDTHYAVAALQRVEMDQLVSIVAVRVQKVIGDQFVLPYFALRNNGASQEDIKVALSDRVESVTDSLILLEKAIKDLRAKPDVADGKFLVGDHITWADVFLFPLLRDLKATKLVNALHGGANDCVPWLAAWYAEFEKRESAMASFPGTFASSV